MLVLTRKSQQRIQIGDNITITVLGIKGGAVRLGIDAPPQVRVLRGELETRDDSAPQAESRESIVQRRIDPALESTLTKVGAAVPAPNSLRSNRSWRTKPA